jgi:FlaA1/EpsC-like NDP-sugar epimerase
MKKGFRNRYVLLVDVLLVITAVLGSFALRLELTALPFYAPAIWTMAAIALAVKIPVYFAFGLYRRLWVYASTNELKLIAVAVTTGSVILSAIMFTLASFNLIYPGMPRSAVGIDWLLSLVLVGGFRFALRIQAETRNPAAAAKGKTRRVLVIGAGDAGALVVREMQKSRHLNLHPVGLLDDDPVKQRNRLYDVPVIGKIADLGTALDDYQVDEVIIAIPTAPGSVVRLVADVCRLKGVPFRTMPGLYELIGGRVSVSRLREVDITDLLRRKQVRINNDLVGAALAGKRVLVTGAGGSIGSELCRQIARWDPASLVLLGHGENSIFEILLELKDDYPELPIYPVIADIRDAGRLQAVFAEHRPQVIFHAAAHKHVPLMEANVSEAVTNNVEGTRRVAEAALGGEVERFVLISTDKAVAPTSVYGATKRLAEMTVLDAARKLGRAFTVVRFGNVLGSRGSIIPKFKRQIASGGPVTITHPGMRRFFMTIPEAVHLVLQASSMGAGGEVFVLNMGEPVRILDLAEDLIRLSGLEPGRDIEIVFTGIRPGEKLTEELWDAGTPLETTPHPDIFRLARDEDLRGETLDQLLDRIISLARAADTGSVVALLDETIPGAAIRNVPQPDVTSVV